MKRESIPLPGPIPFLRAIFGDWLSGVSSGLSVPLTVDCLLNGGPVNGEYLVGLYNSSENVATNVIMSDLRTDKGDVIEFSVVPTVLKVATATWMDYTMKLFGPTPVPGNNNLIRVLKLSSTLPTGQRTASYPASPSFSNYGDLDRWQTDFTVSCDFNQSTVSFVPGACRKVTA